MEVRKMANYYVYGKTVKIFNDLSTVLKNWNDMESRNGYKAVGLMSEDGLGGCDIVVENNGELYISNDYKAFGWTICEDMWADIYYMLLREKKSRMEKKKYWWLPLDNYNQPNGNIVQLEMNDYEYQAMKKRGEYVYDSYMQALMRAQD